MFESPGVNLTIVHLVTVPVGEYLQDRGACLGKSGIVSASGEKGARNLVDIINGNGR